MNWRVVHASAPGTSHIASGQDCDDESWAAVDFAIDGRAILSIFVADGAGSASRGGFGARLAIETAARFVKEQVCQADTRLDEALADNCIKRVRTVLLENAEGAGMKPRDFACTFLGVLSSDHGTVVVQIGDGGIVLDVGEGLEVSVKPQQGEFANMTNFITDESALDSIEIRAYPSRAVRAAAFSDGLQRLALNIASNTPHEPFFEGMFSVLANSEPAQEERLQAALLAFLNSAAVNERTDDDKSLALAVLSE